MWQDVLAPYASLKALLIWAMGIAPKMQQIEILRVHKDCIKVPQIDHSRLAGTAQGCMANHGFHLLPQ